MLLLSSDGAFRGTKLRPGPRVRAVPVPIPPVPIASGRPSVACSAGSWQVAHEISRLPLRILSNSSARPSATSAGSCWGGAAIGTTPHWPMLRRSCASSDSGKLVGGVSSHAAASSSAATHSGLTETVMMNLRAGSMDRQRQRDLMSSGIDVDQAQRTTRHRQDRPARDRKVANTHEKLAARTAGPFRDAAAIAELELREAERQAPGRRPLEPTGAQGALRELDMVGLLQPIVDGAHHQPELQADRLRRACERDVATHADAEHRVGELEPVFDRLAADRNRVAPERGGRSDRVSPGVAPNRLVNRIDAERRWTQHLGQSHAEIVRVGAARIPRNHGDIRDVIVRELGVRRAIDRRHPTDAPTGRRERHLVLELCAPCVRMIEVVVGARLQHDLLQSGIPELIHIEDVVRSCEAVVEDDRLEGPRATLARPFLQRTHPEIDSMAGLRDSNTAIVEQVDAIERMEPCPERAAANGEVAARPASSEHSERILVAVRAKIGTGYWRSAPWPG